MRPEPVYEEISMCSQDKDDKTPEQVVQYDEPYQQKPKGHNMPMERANYTNTPQTNGYNDPVCCEGYERASGYETPVQNIACLIYHESKNSTPECSTLTLSQPKGIYCTVPINEILCGP